MNKLIVLDLIFKILALKKTVKRKYSPNITQYYIH